MATAMGCVVCGSPRYPGSQYCSKTCRDGGAASVTEMCVVCDQRPRYTNSAYCTRRCRDRDSDGAQARAKGVDRTGQSLVGGTTTGQTLSSSCVVCTRGTRYPRSAYCSITCREQDPDGTQARAVGVLRNGQPILPCVMCNRGRYPGSAYCSTRCRDRDDCGTAAFLKGYDREGLRWTGTSGHPGLMLLSDEQDELKTSLQDQFTRRWQTNSTAGSIVAVLKIHVPPDIYQAFLAYRESVAREGVHVRANAGSGNTVRRFHGTSCKCRLAQPGGNESVCGQQACAVCSIITNGFDLRFAGRATGRFRFGRGLYFTACSGKSNDYAGANHFRYMFVCKVVAGRAVLASESWWNEATGPDPGYHSVVGDPKHAVDMNYDEIVVYRNEAAVPFCLIVYHV